MKPIGSMYRSRWKLGSMVRINGSVHLLINMVYCGPTCALNNPLMRASVILDGKRAAGS